MIEAELIAVGIGALSVILSLATVLVNRQKLANDRIAHENERAAAEAELQRKRIAADQELAARRAEEDAALRAEFQRQHAASQDELMTLRRTLMQQAEERGRLTAENQALRADIQDAQDAELVALTEKNQAQAELAECQRIRAEQERRYNLTVSRYEERIETIERRGERGNRSD